MERRADRRLSEPTERRRLALDRGTAARPARHPHPPDRRRRHRAPPVASAARASTSEGITVVGLIPPGHKIATRAIAAGAPVRRYNQIIGFATQRHRAGQHVHTHNLAFVDFARDYAVGARRAADRVRRRRRPRSTGIVRADGRVATRNYIGILTSVNCSATVARAIADHFRRDIHPEALARYPERRRRGRADARRRLRDRQRTASALQVLRRTLGGYARHANFAARAGGRPRLRDEPDQRPDGAGEAGRKARACSTFSIQDTGGTDEDGRARHRADRVDADGSQPRRRASRCRRSHITVGLQCGGSDGYSGISANPALGAAVDRLVRHGGTAILSETPEIYGGEHLLTRRAVSPRGRPTSWSRASAGGRPTRERNGARWTTTRRPATRPAA